jgi:hypothetical protein
VRLLDLESGFSHESSVFRFVFEGGIFSDEIIKDGESTIEYTEGVCVFSNLLGVDGVSGFSHLDSSS